MSKRLGLQGTELVADTKWQVISRPWAPIDPFNHAVVVELSAVSESTGISFSLQTSYNGSTWHNVGSAASVDLASNTFTDSDVTTASNQITLTSHGLSTGDPVILESGGTLPGGLVDGTKYYVVRVDANTIQLAETNEKSFEEDVVGLTSTGGADTHTLYGANLYLELREFDSSDQDVLPLYDSVRGVATTGSGDTATVQEVWVSELVRRRLR